MNGKLTVVFRAIQSIRYVTERDAMTPLLNRFQRVFSTILHLPHWGRSYLGLKVRTTELEADKASVNLAVACTGSGFDGQYTRAGSL